MATFDISPFFRTAAVGIDRTWDQLHTTMNLDRTGHPAYDILRMDEDEFRISLAVPGYRSDEISMETRNGSLSVKAERRADPQHNQYLYRGIGGHDFQRTFGLPEHVEVKNARLEMGMLHIDLVRQLPEHLRPRRIEIEQADDSLSVLDDASKAA
jgi:molecular chaperone IbpA